MLPSLFLSVSVCLPLPPSLSPSPPLSCSSLLSSTPTLRSPSHMPLQPQPSSLSHSPFLISPSLSSPLFLLPTPFQCHHNLKKNSQVKKVGKLMDFYISHIIGKIDKVDNRSQRYQLHDYVFASSQKVIGGYYPIVFLFIRAAL